MDSSFITKTISLGDCAVTLSLPYTNPAKDSVYKIMSFSGKGTTEDCANKDFHNQVYSYARQNKLNFVFFEPGIKAKRVINKRKYYTGIGPHICRGNVLFMEEMPLEISRDEYKNFRGRLTIPSFLEVLIQRGAKLKESS